MKQVLLVGIGRFGLHLAKEMYDIGHEVMAVDHNEDRINLVLDYVKEATIGDVTDPKFIQSLDVSNYDVCIICIAENFRSSLIVTSLLKKNGAKFVVARAKDEVHEDFLKKNGADEVVYPERQMAKVAAYRYPAANLLDYFVLDDEYGIFEVKVPDEWVGKTIVESGARRKHNMNILGIKRNDKLDAEVGFDTVFAEGDQVVILGNIKKMVKYFNL
ncbi:MAG: TrkA family potassium uptake protein [Clostridiales bacterium]|nr:TrkA family potassium uptake protein [Clostridiales bacterium]